MNRKQFLDAKLCNIHCRMSLFSRNAIQEINFLFRSRIQRPSKKAPKKWNIEDTNGIGHIEKPNGGWDSGFGAGHGMAWGDANEYGKFPQAIHEECGKKIKPKEGSCDGSVDSCEKMHDYLPDQHDTVDEHCSGTQPSEMYDYNVGGVEFNPAGVLQISKGHQDETSVDLSGINHSSGGKKNDIAKKRMTTNALRLQAKRKNRRKMLRKKEQKGTRRESVAGVNSVNMSNNQTALNMTKLAEHKHKKHERKSKKKWNIMSGDTEEMFAPPNQVEEQRLQGVNEESAHGVDQGDHMQTMQTCGKRFPLEFCAWQGPNNLVSNGWGGHGWVGAFPHEIHTQEHHDTDRTGYGTMPGVGQEMKVNEGENLYHTPSTIASAPNGASLGTGYHDGGNGFHNAENGAGGVTEGEHVEYPMQQYQNGAMNGGGGVYSNMMPNTNAGNTQAMTGPHGNIMTNGPQYVSESLFGGQHISEDMPAMANGAHEMQGGMVANPNVGRTVTDPNGETMLPGSHIVQGGTMSGPNIGGGMMTGTNEVTGGMVTPGQNVVGGTAPGAQERVMTSNMMRGNQYVSGGMVGAREMNGEMVSGGHDIPGNAMQSAEYMQGGIVPGPHYINRGMGSPSFNDIQDAMMQGSREGPDNMMFGPNEMIQSSRDMGDLPGHQPYGGAIMPGQRGIHGHALPEPHGVAYTIPSEENNGDLDSMATDHENSDSRTHEEGHHSELVHMANHHDPDTHMAQSHITTTGHAETALNAGHPSGGHAISDTVMAGAHSVSQNLDKYKHDEKHEMLKHPYRHMKQLPLPHGHVDINDVHHVGTVYNPEAHIVKEHRHPHAHHVHSYNPYNSQPNGSPFFKNAQNPYFPLNTMNNGVVWNNPHEELPIVNPPLENSPRGDGSFQPQPNGMRLIPQDGLSMNNFPQDNTQVPSPMGGPMGGPMSDQMGGPMVGQMGGQMGVPMGSTIGGPMVGPIGGQMGGHMGGQMGGPMDGQMGGQMDGPLDGPMDGSMGGPMGGPMGIPNQQLGQMPDAMPPQNTDPNVIQQFRPSVADQVLRQNPVMEDNTNSAQEHVFIGPKPDHVNMPAGPAASVRDNSLVEGMETDKFAKRTQNGTIQSTKKDKNEVSKASKGKIVKVIEIDTTSADKAGTLSKLSMIKPASSTQKQTLKKNKTKRSIEIAKTTGDKSIVRNTAKHETHSKKPGKKWTINPSTYGHSETYDNELLEQPHGYNWENGGGMNNYNEDDMGGDSHMESCRLKNTVEYCAWQANRQFGGLRHDEDFGGHGWIGNYAKVHEHEPHHIHTETHSSYNEMDTPGADVTVGEIQHIAAEVPGHHDMNTPGADVTVNEIQHITAEAPEHHDMPDAHVEVGEVHHILTDSPEQHHHLDSDATPTHDEHINVDEVNRVDTVERLPYLQHSLHHDNADEYNHGDNYGGHHDGGYGGNHQETHIGDHFNFNDHDTGEHPEFFGGSHGEGHGDHGHGDYDDLREPRVETSEPDHLEAAPVPETAVTHARSDNDLSHVFVDTGVGSVSLEDHPASIIDDGTIQDNTERDEFAKRTGNMTHYVKHVKQKVIVHPGKINKTENISPNATAANGTTVGVVVTPDHPASPKNATAILVTRRHLLAFRKVHKYRKSI